MSHVICPKCGREVPVGFKSCSNCGQKLDAAELIDEAGVAHAEGRLHDAEALYARAYEAAQRALAHASGGLGHVARDRGDYEAAQYHFEQALKISERTGDTKLIAKAYNNLGVLAMSRGNFDMAQKHFEQALAKFQAIGNIDLEAAAAVKANLALCALEEGDSLGAVTTAEEALAMLRSSDTARRCGQVRAILGEGLLECGDVPGAQREFEKISQDYDKTPDPIEVAQVQRGLGRVALMQGAADKALGMLEHAREGFKRLNRVQEEARTVLYQAIALWQLGERPRARAKLEQAREQFVSMRMRADRDAKRAERLLRELGAASRSQRTMPIPT